MRVASAGARQLEQRAERAPGAGRNVLVRRATVDSFQARKPAVSAPPRWHDALTRPPEESDGFLVGADGRAYPPDTALEDVPAVEPRQGGAKRTMIYVNGVGVPPETVSADLQRLADKSGARVVNVHNATERWFGVPIIGDILQTIGDMFGFQNDNKTVASTADLVYRQLHRGEEVYLVGHSQGGLIVSRALDEVRSRLLAEGRSEAEVKQLFGRIEVETLGGAAAHYPDGPRYTHYINKMDIVPTVLGVGGSFAARMGYSSPGEGARFVEFSFGTFRDALHPVGPDHDIQTYLAQWGR